MLEYLQSFTGISGVEIVVEYGYEFTSRDIELLSAYKYNTLHLHGFEKKDEDWIQYCINTIPNFQHFVLHPDSACLEDISTSIEPWISFENMDIRKPAYQMPQEMIDLFDRFPKSKFTFDINHSEENNLPYDAFDTLKTPSQIHFSVVNKKYYTEYNYIDTPHALACLESDFFIDLKKYTGCIITLE
ncbi:MAG: hypothetical protein U9Q15_04345 [Patescibacteria group bacterium]|nr:hypothetical protein [Patescibacteria group bacterium]